jgi:hypothetical protein
VNGPGSEIRDNYSSMLEKNSTDGPRLMFYSSRVDALPDLTCEWKNCPNDSLYIMILF